MIKNMKAHLTAISRKTLSAPMRWLNSLALIPQASKSLDYGCGRGFDADQLGMDKFDPHYFPTAPAGGYDVVTCNYVLNVIPEDSEREKVLLQLQAQAAYRGTVYVAVRNDKAALKGWTSKGTWQGDISDLELEAKGFWKIRECANFRLFKWRNWTRSRDRARRYWVCNPLPCEGPNNFLIRNK